MGLEGEKICDYKSKTLDHLGLVGAMCAELEIAKEIDDAIPSVSSNRKISTGQLVVAMILNGLGFTSKALYLTPHYFEDKPIDRLIGKNIKSEDLNDDVLGRALDNIFIFGSTSLYSRIAERACNILGLSSKFAHLDSTSFHVEGQYNSKKLLTNSKAQETQVVHVTRGYSRDHRPEANQIMLNLITENQANIPIFMQAANGNQSDQTAFRSIVSNHIGELKNWSGIEYIIADSALYSEATLQTLNDKHLFITRVPETIKEAKILLNEAVAKKFIPIDENYSFFEHDSKYGSVNQRWLLIKSVASEKKRAANGSKEISKKQSIRD